MFFLFLFYYYYLKFYLIYYLNFDINMYNNFFFKLLYIDFESYNPINLSLTLSIQI